MNCLTKNIAELESNLIEVGADWIKTQYELTDSQAREKTLQGVLARLISATKRHHLNPYDLENLDKYAEAKRHAAAAIEYDHDNPKKQ